MKDFKKLRIWQKGLQISIGAYKLIETFTREERFGLSSQITSAAVSIPLNMPKEAAEVVKGIIPGLLRFHWVHPLNLIHSY